MQEKKEGNQNGTLKKINLLQKGSNGGNEEQKS